MYVCMYYIVVVMGRTEYIRLLSEASIADTFKFIPVSNDLYGLPKTHKPQLAMRPILSAQGTYNYALAKWLDEKLKPLSLNECTISDIFSFTEDLRYTSLNESDILVSYDVLHLKMRTL